MKRDAYAAYLAARNPDTPWHVKVLAAVVAAYAFSPIDLIPDFIPVLGYLDDSIRIFVRIHPIHIAQLPNALPKREVAWSKREVSAFDPQSYALDLTHLRGVGRALRFSSGVEFAPDDLRTN